MLKQAGFFIAVTLELLNHYFLIRLATLLLKKNKLLPFRLNLHLKWKGGYRSAYLLFDRPRFKHPK